MAAKRKRRGEPEKPRLTIPEDLVTRLIDPDQVFGALGETDDLEAATSYRVDAAFAEIAQALAETNRPLSWLHLLREGTTARAYRHGYCDGAVAAGWIVYGIAGDFGHASPRSD